MNKTKLVVEIEITGNVTPPVQDEIENGIDEALRELEIANNLSFERTGMAWVSV